VTRREPPRRSPSGVYDWLIPVVLVVLALVLLAIVVAVAGAAFGLWPTE
jgi:hypothetical protein